MAQQIINTGAVANDGTGDPLRTAFTETNNNFTEIYTAGPVDSNVRITNNTILTLNTNGNLVLAPNGTGRVVANVDIVPNRANVRNLGSSTQRWSTIYAQYVDITNGSIYSGDLTVDGNLFANAVIAPELTVNTIRSDDSTVVNIQDGVEVDGDILANGNVTADYVLGDGSQLMNISVGNSGAVQFNWQGSLSNQGGTPGDTYSTLQFDSNGMPTLDGITAYQQRVDYSPYLQVLAPRVESTDFGIVAGPGITVVGYDDNYNTPRSAYLSVQDQATATQQWDFGILGNGSNAFSIRNRTASTIPLVISTDGTVTASTIITNEISSDDSSFVTIQDGLNVVGDIETRGNATADYFIGDGSQLTNLPGGGSYGNSNVATFLAAYGSNTVVTTGNVSAGNVLTSAQIIASGEIQSGTGLFTGGYLSVNGTADLHDTTVTGNLSVNVIRNNDSTVVLIEDGVEVDGDAIVNGNVTADYFVGNGSQLTGISSTGNLAVIGTTIVIDAGAPETSVYISPSGESYAYLELPNNATANTVNTHLWNAAGNVEIGTGDVSNAGPTYTWLFGNDGSTIFPTLTTQRGDTNGGTITGQTLLFGDATQEAVISTPDGSNADGINSQRLVINPGKGEDSNGGEGGDIYLWAGRGGNNNGSGGDVKIRGGYAPADGTGGYIRMDGGASQANGAPGFIEITGGEGGNTTGGYVEITGGQGATVGGDVKMYGGYGTATGGNVNIWGGGSGNGQINEGHVNIQTGGNTWTFATAGNLTLPTLSLGTGLDEQTVVQSQRKIIPPFRWSAVIDGATPTVVYTAANPQTTSMKVTVQVQHQGFSMEFFDVSATKAGADTYYTVSNRVAPPTIAASTVVVDLNGSTMQITVTVNSGAATSWVTYDAVEFGIPND
jgi:hypothetical protein